MTRRLLLAATAAALALAAAPSGLAAGFSKTELTIPGAGGVPLAATLYEPDGPPPPTRFPAIVMFHGLGGTRASTNVLAEQFFAPQGYVVLTFDARGHGASGGLFGLDGPNENADAQALYDFLAARPEVDARHVGAYGISLGGGAVWTSTVIGHVPWAAIVPETTWTDLYDALLPQSLPKSGVVLQLSQLVPPARTEPEIEQRKRDALAGTNLAALRALTAARSVRGRLGGLATPTFLLQGRRDFLFDLAQATAAYRELQGPKRLYVGDFGHAPSTFASPDLVPMETEVRQWFDRFLKGEPNGIDTRPPVEVAKDPYTGTVEYQGLPPTSTLTLRSRPAAALRGAGKVVRTLALPRRRLETFGAPVVRVSVTSDARFRHLVAVLSVLAPGGGETVLSEGGVPLRASRRPRTISIRLLSQAVAIPPGSRLRVTLAATSTAQSSANLLYLLGVPDAARARVRDVRVTLPLLRTPISGSQLPGRIDVS